MKKDRKLMVQNPSFNLDELKEKIKIIKG